jgi:hypothetical protein
LEMEADTVPSVAIPPNTMPRNGDRPRAGTADRPKLATNVRLVGEFQGSGFAEPQWLIEREGKYVQVTDLLYRLAEQLDGLRTRDEVAERLTAATEWSITSDDVRRLIQAKLVPLGLVQTDEQGMPPRPTGTKRSPRRSP